MSFAVPRNVPRFNDARRALEDESWTRVFGGSADGKELPLYKDKPNHNQRHRALWKRRPVLAGISVAVVLIWTLWTRAWPWGAGGLGFRKNTNAVWDSRRSSVRKTFEQSWAKYKEHAWGADVYHPLSRKGEQLAGKPYGFFVLNSLDALMIMNLTAQLSEAREWIGTTLNYTQNVYIDAYDVSVQLLGGLLSADYLSSELPETAAGGAGPGDDLYIETATDLIDRLVGAFDPKTDIPYPMVNLETRQGKPASTTIGGILTAEASGMLLEFKQQTKLTGETLFVAPAEKAVKKIYDQTDRKKGWDGLVPDWIRSDTGEFEGEEIGISERSWPYYANLVRLHLQTFGNDPNHLSRWRVALKGILSHLLARSKSGLFFLTQRPSGPDGPVEPKMDRTACIIPGAIALALTEGYTLARKVQSGVWSPQQDEELEVARELMRGCMAMYRFPATGVAAGNIVFEPGRKPSLDLAEELRSLAPWPTRRKTLPDGWRSDLKIENKFGSQNAETAESLFYLWRVTEDPIFREWGWELYESFVNNTTVGPGGPFASLLDVDQTPAPFRDDMDPMWLSRTLKYLYLLFSPRDLLPLDKVVFSAGAHPFPRWRPRA